jgi:segregation and condensation protein B
MGAIQQHIEALIFVSEESISATDICTTLQQSLGVEITEKNVLEEIEGIYSKYKEDVFAFELRFINNGYQFLTKKKYADTIQSLIKHKSRKKLSTSAMETLAIIAYKQPITKNEIEQIRGVNCDYSVQKLLEKELIAITGKSEGVGRPLLYGTSPLFMDYFGINSAKDLPQLQDFIQEENIIGPSNSEE